MTRNRLMMMVTLVALLIAFLAGRAVGQPSQSLIVPRGSVVVSGNDLGFVVDGRDEMTFNGQLVVRLRGNWHRVQIKDR